MCKLLRILVHLGVLKRGIQDCLEYNGALIERMSVLGHVLTCELNEIEPQR